MNVLSYKEKRPLRIAAALILALAMMVTAMPMTVIAQTVTTASQAAETNETPAQASEAEEAPLAENAAFEEKAEAEENSYEAAAPEAQQETSKAIKTETTVAETSSETRKAKEKALPEKSGQDYDPTEQPENQNYNWNDDDKIDGDTQYANIRYFILDESDTGDNHGLLHEITRSYINPNNLNSGYNKDGLYNNVPAWDYRYYDYYRGNKVKLSSSTAVDVAERFLGDRAQNRGSAIQLNFVGMDGDETNYSRYSVCYAIGTSTGTDLNFFDNTEVYEKTKFFQCGNVYYGPTEGGPYIKSVAGDGTAVAQNSGKQVSKVLWSFNEAAEDYREYDGSPAVFVIFKRADGMNYGHDNNLIISHKALSEADGAIYPETNVLNGNGARTITKCQLITRSIYFNDVINDIPFVAVEGTNDIRITEQSLRNLTLNYTEDSTKSIRIELASEDDNIEDVFVQTAKANVTNPNVYRAVTSTNSSPKDINSVVWKKVEVEESGVTKTYYEADAFVVVSLLDSANDDNLNDSEKTVVETLYSNASSETFSVSCKYYDKDRTSTNSNEPAKVSPIPTVLPDKSASLSNGVNGLYLAIVSTTTSYGMLGSALDEVAFFGAQGLAENNFNTGSAPCPSGSHNSDYYKSFTENKYHTDCFGRHHDDNDYMKEYKETAEYQDNGGKIDDEKWVTYYDAVGNEIDENDLYNGSVDIHRLSRVVVWGYNYPKKYTVNYFIPTDNQSLNETYEYTDSSNASKTVHFTSEDTNKNVIKRKYYYNQRLGDIYVKPNQEPKADDPRNTVSYHLKQWGITDINGIADDSLNGNTSDAKVEAPESAMYGDTPLVFDGWYVKQGNKYVKISSDKEYNDRVLSNLTLFAGYTEATNKPEEDCGVSITSLETEEYYNAGVSRKVLTTVMNAYGYPDADQDLNGNKAAIIYVILYSSVTPSANNVQELLAHDTDFKNDIINALGKPVSPTKVELDVEGTMIINHNAGICYYYTISTTDADEEQGTAEDGNLKLTNKNRAQFVLDMSSNLIDEGGKYVNLLVLVALEHDTDEGTELVFSDDYINYYAGVAQ